jgi:hypothetical protein
MTNHRWAMAASNIRWHKMPFHTPRVRIGRHRSREVAARTDALEGRRRVQGGRREGGGGRSARERESKAASPEAQRSKSDSRQPAPTRHKERPSQAAKRERQQASQHTEHPTHDTRGHEPKERPSRGRRRRRQRAQAQAAQHGSQQAANTESARAKASQPAASEVTCVNISWDQHFCTQSTFCHLLAGNRQQPLIQRRRRGGRGRGKRGRDLQRLEMGGRSLQEPTPAELRSARALRRL